ncbi:hypothetical protein NM962_01275 [Mycobacterium sp. SVM_VP21]|nr:hypothetical protein NM962_01275 [Mycobacterium sp. SVM_VP21]
MNEISPKPEDVLVALDWQTITCQRAGVNCKHPAKVAVEIHAIDCCDGRPATNEYGNVVVIVCQLCYGALIRDTNRYLFMLRRFGRPHCLSCLAPLMTTTDALRAVRPI